MKRLFGPRASTRGNTLVRRIVCAIALIVALTLAVAPLASQGMLPMRFAVHAQNHAQNADSSLAALNSLQSPQSLQSDTANSTANSTTNPATANSTTSTAIAPAVSNPNTANSIDAIHATPIADTTPALTSSGGSTDASDNGVTIKLFDYNMDRQPSTSWPFTVPSINDNDHAMKFGDVYATRSNLWGEIIDYSCRHPAMNRNWNCWTGRPNEVAHPGIVANKLTDGYPTLNPTVTNSSESLAYLFGGASDKAVTKYGVSGGLLLRGSDGYYSFDSSTQYARYDASSGKFTLTTGARSTQRSVPNFTPFNDKSDTSYDYAFGMTVSSNFYMPKDGKINGSDMVFDFAGDDDVWLFVDGALVLDLGGIHGDRGGTIDFATGAITYDQSASSWWKVTRPATLSAAMQNAGLTWDSTAYKQHTFQLFYLERGGGGSNCHMRFNLPTIPEGTLEIAKTVDFGSAVPLDATAFRFAAYIDYDGTENGTNFEQFTGKYDVVDSTGALVRSDVVASDGVITLHTGETARLKAPSGKTIRVTTRYYATELGVSDADYTASVSGVTLTREAAGMTTPTLTVQDVPHLDFTNTVASGNTFTAKITKQCANCPAGTTNSMLVTIAGTAYSGSYTVVGAAGSDTSGTSNTTATTTNGIITLSPGQTAEISGIVGGNTVAVREVNADGTAFSQAGFQAPTYAMGGTALSGTTSTPSEGGVQGTAAHGSGLRANATLDVTVTNSAKSMQITTFAQVRKTVDGQASAGSSAVWRDGDTFTFRLVPIDTDGNEAYGAPMPSACSGATSANPCTVTVNKPANSGSSNTAVSATADFGTLTLTAVGTYRYRVTEVAGSTALQQIYHYSLARYTVVVTVDDATTSNTVNSTGALTATIAATHTRDDDGAPASAAVAQGTPLEFTNTSFETHELPLTGSRSEAAWALAAAVLAALTLAACLVYARVRNRTDTAAGITDFIACPNAGTTAANAAAPADGRPEKETRR